MLSELRYLENVLFGSGRRSAILNLIKLKFFMVYPYRELHILFYSNGLAIWSGFPDITHITKIMADNLPFWPPRPSFCPNLAQLVKWINGMNFGAMHKKNVE